MLVYRDSGRVADAAAELRRLQRLCREDTDVERLLIEWTEFEAAVADALAPEIDTWDERLQRLRAASCDAARLWLTASEEGLVERAPLCARIEAVGALSLPQRITLKVSEGFAFYALFPDAYASSARRFVDELRPPRVCLIGIRGIGCCLSAVAAAAIEQRGCPARTFTVRPRGHPFSRELRLDGRLAEALRAEARDGASFAIVDEGPGLSGSSFASVVIALRALDVEPHRVVFLSSWDPSPEGLRSEEARRVWLAHRRYSNDAARNGLTPERIFGMTAARDWSAGRWRADVLADVRSWPAVRTDHERWKVAIPEDRIVKFVGLGSYGAAARNRAELLHDLGVGARPGELRRGFLELAFVPGHPLDSPIDHHDAARIGAYIGQIARAFPTSESVDTEALALMIETNVRELTGHTSPAFADDVRERAKTLDGLAAAEIDGRVLPHEWIRAGAGLTKVDALDHYRDHFFPGVQGAAWDLAAALVEFDMDDRCAFALVRAFERASEDPASAHHLAFYQLAYTAFRGGYLTMAAENAPPAEASRLRRAAEQYVSRLPTPSAP